MAEHPSYHYLRFSFARIRHYFPERGRSAKLRWAPHSGTLTPPRIAPSCLCRQGYHCRQRRSLRDGLPGPLLDGLNRSSPCCRSFDAGLLSRTGGLGVPSASLVALLKLFSCRMFNCQGALRGFLPLNRERDKIMTFYNLSQKFFRFFLLLSFRALKHSAGKCP